MACSASWWRRIPAVLALIWCGPTSVHAQAEPRLALVVGSAQDQSGRSTSSADAGLIAEVLSQDGFEVTALQDSDGEALRRGSAAFDEKLRVAGGDAIVFVYLSGVGAQRDDGNVFVPAAARTGSRAKSPADAVALADITRPIEALPARARIIVADLARDRSAAKADPLPLAVGLAMARPPKGELDAFNEAPGMIAPPDAPPYGAYARALAEALRTPGLKARAVFTRVRLRVAQMSAGAVVPWDAADLDDDPVLLPAGPAAARPQTAERPIDGLPVEEVFWAAIAEDSLTGYDAFLHAFPDDRLAGRIKAMIAARVEALTWAAALEANSAAAYWTYMLRYPHGAHYVDVRRRLASIHAALAPPPRFDVFDFAGLPVPSSADRHDEPHDASWAPVPALPSVFLPPPAEAVYAALPPPPLAPAGALPIPLPVPSIASTGPVTPQRRIVQPFVPNVGPLSIEPGRGATVMTLTGAGGLLSRTAIEDGKQGRTILQTDPANHVQSRTTTTDDAGRLTIVQTGAGGGILLKMVTTTGADGDRTTTLTNGASQLVAEVQADARGVETGITFGTATIATPPLAVVPQAAPAKRADTTTPPKPPADAPLPLGHRPPQNAAPGVPGARPAPP